MGDSRLELLLGSGREIIGSPSLQTSLAGVEIVPQTLYRFELQNDQDCHIAFNGGAYIFLRAGQGVDIDIVDSCKIQEAGITFNFIGSGE